MVILTLFTVLSTSIVVNTWLNTYTDDTSFSLSCDYLSTFAIETAEGATNNHLCEMQDKKKKKTKTPEASSRVSVGKDDIELVVSGSGSNKESATLAALRDALEQVYGAFVSSDTKILNDEIIKDEIISVSSGFVKGYSYLTEKEIDGVYYVVVKTIVTPKKLEAFVKQKGSDIIIDGSTFGANMRLEQLNLINKMKVDHDIVTMQNAVLDRIFDYKINNVRGPRSVGSNQYAITFDVDIILNENVRFIKELEDQKLNSSFALFDYPRLSYIIPIAACHFKIVDNLGEYWFEEDKMALSHSNGSRYPDEAYYQDAIGLRLKTTMQESRLSFYYHNIEWWFFVTDKSQTRYGYLYLGPSTRSELELNDAEYSALKAERDKIRTLEGHGIDFMGQGRFTYRNLVPRIGYPVFRIRFKAIYSLEDLDRITGIRIVPM